MVDITKPVKLKNPQPGEEILVFVVTDYNEVMQRCVITPTNYDFTFVPGELVSVNDIENV